MTDVLVVIGAGGMGEAIARRLGPGQHVLLADLDQATLERVADSLRGDGYTVDTRQVDVSARDSLAALAHTASGLGAVTQVAHTAGLSPEQAPIEAILRVDLAGVAYSIEEFARVIAPGGSGVVISSMAAALAASRFPGDMADALARTPSDALLTLPFLQPDALPGPGAAYAIAKRGCQLRVQAASLAWGERGARINSISPGVISTPMGQQELAGGSGDSMQAMVRSSGTKRLGTPADIANAAAFLLGPESTFVTGSDLLVDGGVVAAVRSGGVTPPAP